MFPNIPAPPRPLVPAPPYTATAPPPAVDLYATTTGLLDSLRAGGMVTPTLTRIPPPTVGTPPGVMPTLMQTLAWGPSSAVRPPPRTLPPDPLLEDTPAPVVPKRPDKAAQKKEEAKSRHLRKAAGKIWNDPSLDEWPDNDYRVFTGDLGNEVTDEVLTNAFRHFRSFNRAKVIRDSKTGKTRGYGFVSFNKPEDMLAAMKTMDRKYVGNRPIRVIKSKWVQREINSEKNKADAGSMKIAELDSKTTKRFKVAKKKDQ